MKGYRVLLPIALIAMMIGSWYMIISKNTGKEDKYNQYLSEARRWAAEGVPKKTLEGYEKVLAIRDDPDVYVEVSEFFKKQAMPKDNLKWCTNFYKKFPKEPKAYDCMLEAYVNEQDYEKCYDVIETAQKRQIQTDYIDSVTESLKYVYNVQRASYDYPTVYTNGVCPVFDRGYWGYMDRYGNMVVPCMFEEANPFSNEGYASVVSQNKESYFIDMEGETAFHPVGFESLGMMVGGVFNAKIADGRYVYMREKISSGDDVSEDYSDPAGNYEQLSEEYEYASVMNGVAAVKKNGTWQIIGYDFKTIMDGLQDIKLDERQIACLNERLFVAKSEGQYIMVDDKGNQIGSSTFEDAMVFASEDPTAVKVDGKWRFINKDGNYISDKTYDGARPFSNGLAAVCIDGKWGFVDTSETVVIEPEFLETKNFSDKGSCFVRLDSEKWRLLTIYRLNRED